jgi:two-component system, sensor histidine kinase
MFLLRKYDSTNPKDLRQLHFLPTFFVFIVMMIVVGTGYQEAQIAIGTETRRLAEQRALKTESKIEQRLEVYNNILLAGEGLFNASNEVTREEWRNFVETFNYQERYGGALGIGYSKVLRPSELEAYEKEMSQIFNRPNFRVKPIGERDIYTSITFLEPAEGSNKTAIGFDMYSEETRRQAMSYARDNNTVGITGPVALIQDDYDEAVKAILMYKAIYSVDSAKITPENAQRYTLGYAYMPFRTEELFESVVTVDDFYGIKIKDITDNSEPAELYSAGNLSAESYIVENLARVYGRILSIQHYMSVEAVPSSTRERPASLILGGIIFATSISLVAYLLLQRRSRKIAERHQRRLDKAKDDLLSMASHQLRTPATGVKQYIGMALEGFAGEISDDVKNVLDRAYKINERQLHIINEFLYLAKIDAQRMVLSKSELNLKNIVNNITDDMRSEIKEKKHKIITKINKNFIIYSDYQACHMIIENLISNAIKYTPDGGTIHIAAKKNDAYIHLKVMDNGVGVKDNHEHRLFTEFSRIPNELTKKTSGSGIGLYVAKHLALLNGGDITFKRRPRRGSIFTASFLDAKNVKNVTDNTTGRQLE